MPKFSYILFDLDGTLIDTTPLILESFRHTFLYHFNEHKDDSELIAYLGIPLRAPFEAMYPGMEDILIKTYREFNETRHDRYAGIFVGVVQVLEALKQKGVTLGVVTSKRHALALRGLKLFEIDRYMSVIIGPEDTTRHKPFGDPLLKALETCGIKDKSSVLYVGDSIHDVLCAKDAGIASAAVLWTYFPQEEIVKVNPDLLLKKPQDLLMYV